MPLGALTMHQLRYYLIFGPHAAARLARGGHAYLAAVEPLVLLVATFAVGALVGRRARAWSSGEGAASPPRAIGRTWLLCACALLALYCAQELAEGALASGHPVGIAGILGHGGLVAVPLAAFVAGLLALGLRTAEALIELAARRGAARHSARAEHLSPVTIPLRLSDWRLEPQSLHARPGGLRALRGAVHIRDSRDGVGLGRSPEQAALSQRWMLVVMVTFTCLGLWLLSAVNT